LLLLKEKMVVSVRCSLISTGGGEEGDVFYPADINMQLTWHDGVKPGALIRREHDMFMLKRWMAT
jgi:hypothetical protein